MSRFEGNIAGKNIITYTPKGNKQYSHDDLGRYLRKFKLCDALGLIGELSYRIFISQQALLFIKRIPVFDGVLAYLSMRLIESSNDYRSRHMSLDDLLTAIDMFFGLPDPFQEGGDNPQGCLVRFGSSQFDYDREARHLLPRTLIMYEDLWSVVPNSNQVNISAAIHEITGLTLKEILVLSLVFSFKSRKGFFHLYEEEETNKYPDAAKPYFDVNKQRDFVNWISCKYAEFRNWLKEDSPPTIEHEKFRFNPLHVKPVIIPDRNLKPGFSQVYITPIPTLIYERSTRGLYFSLTDHFRQSRGNPFRDIFGFVFEEYVGLLLKKTFGESNVQRNWRYGSKSLPKDTPDWFVILNGIAVLIEVKQSGLYLPAKKWGEIEDIQRDLTRNIGAGVSQIWEFEHDLENGSCIMPGWFSSIEITERMVVTYDRSYFLNSILRDEVRRLYPHIPATYHWHTVAVEELEYFLGTVGSNFMQALAEKRLDPEGDGMDFRDYCPRKYTEDEFMNPYLSSIYDQFFSELGLPSEKIGIE